MSDYRKGGFKLKNKEIKLIVVGDGVFLPDAKLLIPAKAKEGVGYIEDGKYIYFGAKTELDSSGKEAIPFNAYDGYPINETWKVGLKVPVALVVKGDYNEGQSRLIHSRASTLNFTFLDVDLKKQENKRFAVYLGVKDKMAKLRELCEELNIKPQNVLYIDNDLDIEKDRELLNSVALVVCQQDNLNYDNVVNENKLIKIDAKSGDALIRTFSDNYIETSLKEAQDFHEETRKALASVPKEIKGSKSSGKKIKLMIFDIDGTCTNNMKIYSVDGNEFKRFSLKDLDSVRGCLKQGYEVAFVTGDETSIPKNLVKTVIKGTDCVSYEIDAKPYSKENAKDFENSFIKEFKKLPRKEGEKEVFIIKGSSQKKVDIVNTICKVLGLTLDEVAYMGDENNEIGVVELVISNGGVGACPSSSTDRIKETKDILVLKSKGGRGNIQEFIDYIYTRNKI